MPLLHQLLEVERIATRRRCQVVARNKRGFLSLAVQPPLALLIVGAVEASVAPNLYAASSLYAVRARPESPDHSYDVLHRDAECGLERGPLVLVFWPLLLVGYLVEKLICWVGGRI